MKVNARPMPLTSAAFYRNKTTPLTDLVVKAGDKPWLVLTLKKPELLSKVNCFATGQGAITTEVVDDKLWVQARQPLAAGRTRYNCTAASGEKGRFFWFTQQWLATDKNGEWTYKD